MDNVVRGIEMRIRNGFDRFTLGRQGQNQDLVWEVVRGRYLVEAFGSALAPSQR